MKRNTITESPDGIIIDKKKLTSINDRDSRAFGYYDNIFYLGGYNSLHPNFVRGKTRRDFKFAGRLWEKSKLISFWEYPSVSEFKKILRELSKQGISVNSSWKVEVIIDDKENSIKYGKPGKEDYWRSKDVFGKYDVMLVPVNKYGGSIQRDKYELGKDHEESPMTKKKKRVPAGIGSRKKPHGYKSGETVAQTHFRMRQEQKLRKAIRSMLKEESNLLKHATRELKLAGYNFDKKIDKINSDDDYANLIAKCVLDLIKDFAGQHHSGFSAEQVRNIFNKLSNFETLTPITNNPDEWEDMAKFSDGKTIWQNIRNPKYFSEDGGRTWYTAGNDSMNEAYKLVKLSLKDGE